MQVYDIKRDEQGRELTKHGDESFPCAGYDESFSEFVLNEVPWHWHDEIEIVYVYQGEAKVELAGQSTSLKCGECIFINSNRLHRMTQVGTVNCKIINFVLKPEFLGGRTDSRIYREYILPICANEELIFMKLTGEVKWQKDALEQMKSAFDAYAKSEFGYEIIVQSRLIEMWRIICINNKSLLESFTVESSDNRRIKKILEFVHSNYTDKISVYDIASAAGISESECYRLFKRMLKCTPNNYLLDFRLHKAAELISETDESITEIASNLCFSSPAYFSKRFKELYNKTPLEFRKNT